MQVSQSQIRCFKACRRLYELKYIEGLQYNKDIEPLKVGASYHEKIEQLYSKGYFDCDNSKVDAMAFAYEMFIYPKFKVKVAEKWFEYQLNDKHSLIGRVDAIAEDGLLVEHKTTSSDITEEYVYNLQWDEQVLSYMLAYGVREMYYTVCKKPTIRQKTNETDEEFFERCCKWYEEDTEDKIKVFKVTRTDEEIEKYKQQLIETIDEMEKTTLFYNNTSNCTCWGRRCEYSSICLNYDAKLEYIDFTKVDKEEKRKEMSGDELY